MHYVCVCFVEGNPDYTHSVSHLRRKRKEEREEGKGEEESERGGAGLVGGGGVQPSRHPLDEQQSQICDSPHPTPPSPQRLLHWQPGGYGRILGWKQPRASTQPARGLHSLS